MDSTTAFRVYRYQLLPLDRNQTKSLFNELSTEEVIAVKNTFFAQAILAMPNQKWGEAEIIVKASELTHELLHITFAPSRSLTRETADSRIEKIDHWPHITTYLLNAADDQYLLVQDRVAAFNSTDTVTNLIRKGTRGALEQLGLSLQIEPLFDKRYFWELVKKYKNQVTEVSFEFITPNMANISRALSENLKSLAKESNSVREQLTLSADVASSLDLAATNPTINGLVDYTSEGGGDITLKIKGIRKKMHTSKESREIRITELELRASAQDLKAILKDLLR